ncbi:MAG: BtpA/SgcQ family protein, partial [Myxococcota bacterium]|nr:BtpA/SgcQ family protein [Myxococcota bacterium]
MSSFALLGVAHLLPLPGTPSSTFDLDSITRRALDDIRVLHDAGFQGAVLENFGDAPFRAGSVSPHIVAMMSVIAYQIRTHVPKNFQLGINVLRNDARAAMAVASSVNADFIRVNVHIGAAWTDQGLIEGTAYETLQYKNQLRSSVKIAADVLVKHAAPAGVNDIEILAKDTYFRGKAQTLIVTGSRTG